MDFFVTQLRVGVHAKALSTCYLSVNRWDDFGFKVSFEVTLFDDEGTRHDLGQVRILRRGMEEGYPLLPDRFEILDQDFCSLGANQKYYLLLAKIPNPTKSDYLKSVRDCVYDLDTYYSFASEKGMQTALLRSVTPSDVTKNFPRILEGDQKRVGYRCFFEFEVGGNRRQQCKFFMDPGSSPPTNLHAIIGKNGVGKTRLLAGIADALTGNQAAAYGLPGKFRFDGAESLKQASEFKSLIIVAFSVFDRFHPTNNGVARSGTSLPFHYVGIKKILSTGEGVVADQMAVKTTDDLETEFQRSLTQIGSSTPKIELWEEALGFLDADMGLKDYHRLVQENFSELKADKGNKEVLTRFKEMSSGHKIVLLTITRIVELIADQSIILLDEPETHLHPPLLGSFLRALSSLLKKSDSLALLATHSPVALQEIPETCVSILLRSGESMNVVEPELETFAESVSTLTRKVFGLELEQSGYYRMIKEAAKDLTYDQLMEQFSGQVGAEGRALARVLTKG